MLVGLSQGENLVEIQGKIEINLMKLYWMDSEKNKKELSIVI